VNQTLLIEISYVAAAVLFIFGLKMLSSPATARRGNMISAIGMLLAIVVTLVSRKIIAYEWIIGGILLGGIIGAVAARKISMTGMPEMVAIFNGFGGIASLLVGWAEFHPSDGHAPAKLIAIVMAVLIGGVTFTGSLVAYGKLSGKITGKPVLFGGQKVVNALILLGAVVCGAICCFAVDGTELGSTRYTMFIVVVVIAFVLGIMAVIPIGGADMPVVISLLNSYSGLAACAAGFVILNNILIVSGALVGASGIILTKIMCKAMNRSLANVLFSGFGSAPAAGAGGADVQGEAKPIIAGDAYFLLEAAQSVIIVPGYGMAVAQAQHAVRELCDQLQENGCDVRFAIHPVAGRMPGHMNVLLAEANVPYDQLFEPDDVNPTMEMVDVAVVIGANDVVNPSARDDKTSPIYGMPTIDVDRARTCIVLKRSLGAGFAQIENPLFFKENTRMLFGDAKQSVSALVGEFKSE
jgi:NAD(P) transhydrogenase subunit beta